MTELLNYKPDGTAFRNALIISPIFDHAGHLAWFVGSQVEVGGGTHAPTELGQRRALDLVERLSPRQRDVLREMARVYRNKQIAWKLVPSEKTVKMHRSILLDKLGITTSAEAIRVAVEAGL